MKADIAFWLRKIADRLAPLLPLQPEIQIVYVQPTAKAVVDSILDRPLEWVNWKEMPAQERKNWGAIARAALDNRALQSLIGTSKIFNDGPTNGEIAKRCIENIARYSKSHVETENVRHVICGAELIRELLEEMLWNEDKHTSHNPNATI